MRVTEFDVYGNINKLKRFTHQSSSKFVIDNFDPTVPRSLFFKAYETTWRTETYKDSSAATQDANTQDTIQYQPTIYMLPTGPEVVDFLYEGGKEFGYNINTSLVVYDALYYYNEVYSNTFWGNSQGMFQNFSNYSYYSIVYPYVQTSNAQDSFVRAANGAAEDGEPACSKVLERERSWPWV